MRNDSPSPVGIGGWQIREWVASSGSIEARFTVPGGVVLMPGCHYLAAFPATVKQSLASTEGVPADGHLSNLTTNGGIALVRTDGAIVDQVGMNPNSPFKEGTTLPPSIADYHPAYTRGGNDTNNNASDFLIVFTRTPMNSGSSCAVR